MEPSGIDRVSKPDRFGGPSLRRDQRRDAASRVDRHDVSTRTEDLRHAWT